MPNSTERITAGDGNDTIEIDTISKATPGIVVDAGAGNDLIKLTSNSSSNSAISNIDGGSINTIKFSPGLDYSLNDLTVVNVEKLEFSGGSSSTKLQSDVLTEKLYLFLKKIQMT